MTSIAWTYCETCKECFEDIHFFLRWRRLMMRKSEDQLTTYLEQITMAIELVEYPQGEYPSVEVHTDTPNHCPFLNLLFPFHPKARRNI